MLQEVSQHPGSGWLWLLQLFLSGRPISLLPIEASGSSTQPNSFGQILLSLRGRARQDVHVEIEVPLGMFLPTRILSWIYSSTSTIQRICPFCGNASTIKAISLDLGSYLICTDLLHPTLGFSFHL